MNYVKFATKPFDELDNTSLKVFRDYYYIHGFWFELNLKLDKTCNMTLLEAVAAK